MTIQVYQVTEEERPLTKGVRVVVTDLDDNTMLTDVIIKDDHILLCHGRCYVSYEQMFGKAKQYTIRYDGDKPRKS